MQIRIKNTPDIPEMRYGGFFGPYPYAGSNVTNPFGLVNSDTSTDSENINSSMKAVDREDANIEAEKGEVLLRGDLAGLFNIGGKRHSQGGTPLIADGGDFIFSRDKELAITKEEKELFGFKKGGTYKKSENTPAKIVQKETNPKHYNELVAILKDPKSDKLARRTAELMLGKYSEKLGQIAYLQESKKDFPNGLPEFTQDTAPVRIDSFENIEAKEDMYRVGGIVDYKKGGINTFNSGQVNQLKQRGAWDNNEYWNRGAQNLTNLLGYTGDNSAPQMQQFVTQNYPELVNHAFNQGYWPNTNKGVNQYGDVPANQLTSEQQLGAFADNLRGVRFPMVQPMVFNSQQELDDWARDKTPVTSNGRTFYDTRQGDLVNYTLPSVRERLDIDPLTTGTFEGMPNIVAQPASPTTVANNNNPSVNPNSGNVTTRENTYETSPGIAWNAQEMLSTAMPFLSALATPNQYPLLQQQHTPNIRLDRVSNAQEITDIKQQGALAQREISANMVGKNAYIASSPVRSQMIQAIGQSNNQNENVNTQISNQEDQTNYAAMVQDRDVNNNNIARYWDQTNLVQGRRNQELRNAATESLNTGLSIQGRLDSLQQVLDQADMAQGFAPGQGPITLDRRTRRAIPNPGFKGDIFNNPFISGTAGSAAGVNIQSIANQLNDAIERGADAKTIYALSNALKNVSNIGKSTSTNPIAALYAGLNYPTGARQ